MVGGDGVRLTHAPAPPTRRMKDDNHNDPWWFVERLPNTLARLPKADVLRDLWKTAHNLLQQRTSPDLYQVLEYESTLELHDRGGGRATFAKREKVRYLQDNVIAYQDQAWGDGEILLNYRCSPRRQVGAGCVRPCRLLRCNQLNARVGGRVHSRSRRVPLTTAGPPPGLIVAHQIYQVPTPPVPLCVAREFPQRPPVHFDTQPWLLRQRKLPLDHLGLFHEQIGPQWVVVRRIAEMHPVAHSCEAMGSGDDLDVVPGPAVHVGHALEPPDAGQTRHPHQLRYAADFHYVGLHDVHSSTRDDVTKVIAREEVLCPRERHTGRQPGVAVDFG